MLSHGEPQQEEARMLMFGFLPFLVSADVCHVCWLVVRRQVGGSSSLLPLQVPGTQGRCPGL